MKKIIILLLVFSGVVFSYSPLIADELAFNKLEMSYKNFVRCELTRTDAKNHFNGKPFKINMIDLFDIQNESGIKIVTGAVKCFVVDKSQILYAAVGLKTIMGKEEVVYYTIKNKDFFILATELIKYPYKERCKWSQYWIDID